MCIPLMRIIDNVCLVLPCYKPPLHRTYTTSTVLLTTIYMVTSVSDNQGACDTNWRISLHKNYEVVDWR